MYDFNLPKFIELLCGAAMVVWGALSGAWLWVLFGLYVARAAEPDIEWSASARKIRHAQRQVIAEKVRDNEKLTEFECTIYAVQRHRIDREIRRLPPGRQPPSRPIP